MERHHKDVLSRHRHQSWYILGVILRKTGKDVYVIQVRNNKTVERDCTQLLPREPGLHGRAVTLEFTADVFDSDNDREEDDYTAERILSDKPDPSTAGERLYMVRWKGFAASRDSREPPSSFVPRYTSVWLDYLKAKRNKLDVKDVLVHLVMSLRILLCIHMFAFNFFAVVMHVPRLRTCKVPPPPNFIDMRRAFGTKISLWLCSLFLCAQSVTACSGDGCQGPWLSRIPHNFLFFLGGAFSKCIGGSDTPAISNRL